VIATFLARQARDHPKSLAFSFRGEALTFAALLEDAESIAGMLRHDGVDIGDRVAVRMEVGLDLVRVFFALQRIGAVPCIFDPHVPDATLAARIAGIRARRTIDAVPRNGAKAALPPLPDDENAVAILQLTSGTSGEAQAAMLLQRNVLASLESSRELIDPVPSDVFVGWVPPWHDLGLFRFLLAPVFFGLPCHLVTPAIRTIPEWLASITASRGTITGAPDFAWRLAARLADPAAVDLRSMRLATNGGEPVRASTIAAFEARFGSTDAFRPGYGLAEASLGVSCRRAGEPLRVDARGNVSCGRPLENVEVRIDDGEILVRGPAVFAGYFDAPEATAEVLRGGWLHTGDAGTFDDSGNLYVLGRRRAMIKRAGATFAPREIEEAVQIIPGVRLAAAVGVPSTLTEDIVVVVETERGINVERDVIAAVERSIGMAPDRVVIQPPRTIPMTGNGKIRHAVLRDQLIESRKRSRPSESSDGAASR
jgi:acyl-CoA synthetase (AMP-forming)/AMP-acid ligase II